jgi:hypothetical protein
VIGDPQLSPKSMIIAVTPRRRRLVFLLQHRRMIMMEHVGYGEEMDISYDVMINKNLIDLDQGISDAK